MRRNFDKENIDECPATRVTSIITFSGSNMTYIVFVRVFINAGNLTRKILTNEMQFVKKILSEFYAVQYHQVESISTVMISHVSCLYHNIMCRRCQDIHIFMDGLCGISLIHEN